MQLNGVTAVSTASRANTEQQSSNSTGTLDYNAFLTLLTAQLKNQDPTKPIDSTQYISQLASFSNVEQGIMLNAKLESLITAQSVSQAETLIGRTISSADGSVTGVVTGVRILDGGAVAMIEGGREVEIVSGISIGEA